MSDQPQIAPKEKEPAGKKEDQIPDLDLLSLAEERAASAPIADFGVFLQGLLLSSRTVLRTRKRRCSPARSTTTTITRDLRIPG